MSLTAAMNSAVSGLTAVTHATELIASNIANATTPGYARRSLELSSYGSGLSGTQVIGVVRHSDPILLAQRREADAVLAQADIRAQFHEIVVRQVGQPGDEFGLNARLADFEASLIAASSRPDLQDRLDHTVVQAGELTALLNEASNTVQAQRKDADQAINSRVETLNTSLQRLQEINSQVTKVESSGGDVSGLLDQRQVLLDQVNRIAPVTVCPLYTSDAADDMQCVDLCGRRVTYKHN